MPGSVQYALGYYLILATDTLRAGITLAVKKRKKVELRIPEVMLTVELKFESKSVLTPKPYVNPCTIQFH